MNLVIEELENRFSTNEGEGHSQPIFPRMSILNSPNPFATYDEPHPRVTSLPDLLLQYIRRPSLPLPRGP